MNFRGIWIRVFESDLDTFNPSKILYSDLDPDLQPFRKTGFGFGSGSATLVFKWQ